MNLKFDNNDHYSSCLLKNKKILTNQIFSLPFCLLFKMDPTKPNVTVLYFIGVYIK